MFNNNINNQNNGDYGKEVLSQESEISSIFSQETMKLMEMGGDSNLPFNLTPNSNSIFQSPCEQKNISTYEIEIAGTELPQHQRIEFEAAVNTFQPPYQALTQPSFYGANEGPPAYNVPFRSYNNDQHTELDHLYQSDIDMAPPVPASTQNFEDPSNFATNYYDSRSGSSNVQAFAPQVLLPPFHQLALSDGGQIVEPLPFTPSNKKFAGIYDFDIIFPPPGAFNSDFMYSTTLNKFYVKQDTTCMFRFRIKLPSSSQSVQQAPFRLRALPLFKELDQCHLPVFTCPLHPNADIHRRSSATGHLILSDDTMATYELDLNINRRSVTVPLNLNDLDVDNSINVPLKFACFSSCVGGINRRQLQIIFTLERGTELIGRTTVDLRICAAPLRDIKKEEKLNDPQRKKSKVTTREVNYRGSKRVRLNAINSDYSPASNNSNSSDALSLAPTSYTIIVLNHELYELLMGIKESFELCEKGASNQILQYSKSLASQLSSKPSTTSGDDRNDDNGRNEVYSNENSNGNRNAHLNLSTKELYDMTLEIAKKAFKAASKIYRSSVDFNMFREEEEMDFSQVPRPYLKSIIDVFMFWTRDFMKIRNAYNISLPASLSSETSSTEKTSQESHPTNVLGDNCYNPLINRIRQPAWPSDFSYIVYQYRFRHTFHHSDRTNNRN